MIDFKLCIYRVRTIFSILFISFPSPSFQNSLQSLAWRRSLCRLPVATSFTSDAWVAGCRRNKNRVECWPSAKPCEAWKRFGTFKPFQAISNFHKFSICIDMYIILLYPETTFHSLRFSPLVLRSKSLNSLPIHPAAGGSKLSSVSFRRGRWDSWDFTSNFIGKKLWDPIQCFFLLMGIWWDFNGFHTD